jgi:cysteinyl-tRNA synthetase
MAKSAGGFLRVQTLIDKGYDPLVYRYFCLSALYRAKLSFSWESMDSAATSLNRLRNTAFEWGVPGSLEETYLQKFGDAINDDLNMPKALAVVWDLVRSDLPAGTRKATLLKMDEILGLDLANWQPKQEEVPAEVAALLEARTLARKEKRWGDADSIRAQITELGYEIEDTPQGPKVKKK